MAKAKAKTNKPPRKKVEKQVGTVDIEYQITYQVNQSAYHNSGSGCSYKKKDCGAILSANVKSAAISSEILLQMDWGYRQLSTASKRAANVEVDGATWRLLDLLLNEVIENSIKCAERLLIIHASMPKNESLNVKLHRSISSTHSRCPECQKVIKPEQYVETRREVTGTGKRRLEVPAEPTRAKVVAHKDGEDASFKKAVADVSAGISEEIRKHIPTSARRIKKYGLAGSVGLAILMIPKVLLVPIMFACAFFMFNKESDDGERRQ